MTCTRIDFHVYTRKLPLIDEANVNMSCVYRVSQICKYLAKRRINVGWKNDKLNTYMHSHKHVKWPIVLLNY